MLARTLMIQGTASSVGKSLLTTAFCRIFRQMGLRVAPFKSQNMSLNSYVTPEGGEIGRAQAVQAEAAGIPCSVRMNPILLKPEAGGRSQVIVLGKPLQAMSVQQYQDYKPELRRVIIESLEELRRICDILVIEGAGSPAEINLKEHDLANMFVAKAADAPVLLAGDIDRGGVFASLVGTLELLDSDERARVAGFIINKFRGEKRLLDPGLEELARRTGKPALGVVPFIHYLKIADEDAVALEEAVPARNHDSDKIVIAVVKLPCISNFDDFDPLKAEKDVALRFVERPEECSDADLLVLPGTKSTVADLEWLRRTGLAELIENRTSSHRPVLGICGGCQMLGTTIEDPLRIESPVRRADGLKLLPLVTRFEREKTTARVKARVTNNSFLATNIVEPIDAYEIHMGTVLPGESVVSPFEIIQRNGQNVKIPDGAIGQEGSVVGTLLHGIFNNDALRQSLLNHLRQARGKAPVTHAAVWNKEEELDRLAALVREHVNMEMLKKIAKI
jgi:adenosylcobyric acid synthase